MLIAILLILGLILGSFINALVWRLRQHLDNQQPLKAILTGRSMCPNCGHQLSTFELLPVVSWLALRGRCRHCRAPISKQYPLVEAITALVFVSSYIFWPVSFGAEGQWLLLSTWLATSVGLIALAVYDARWMLLPNHIIYPTLAAAAAGQGAYTVFFAERPLHYLGLWILSVAVASGFFWVIYLISKGKWIGYGDVRLGLITGTVLAEPSKALAMLFFASVLGTIVALPGILTKQKSLSHKLPFGPFLITATAFVLLFGQPILDWYKNLLGV